jgi:glycosyltransferase involved in cell wall biosynthesis
MNLPSPRPRSRSIVFIAADLSSGGGVNKVVCDLARLFAQTLLAKVRVVSARSDRPSAYRFASEVGVETHCRQSLPAYFLLLRKLRRSRPDVVISSWTQDNILVALAFAFSSSTVILVEHSSWHFHGPMLRALRRIAYPLASEVVVLNPTDLDHYCRSFSRVRLIPDPVSVEAPPKVKREKLILAVGHLTPIKQFDQAIRAFAESNLEREGWSLAIVGSGPDREALQWTIERHGLERATIQPPTGNITEYYARASLVMLTSRTESFSLVLAEAMMSGVIPVAYATDGPSFILEEFADHLVPIGDVKRLAGRLIHFANAPEPEPLRQALKTSIERRFGEDVVAQSWKDLLYEVTPAESRA